MRSWVVLIAAFIGVSGCADLVVREVTVEWTATSKRATAEVANVGSGNAGQFLAWISTERN
jgi:uncharacterized protein YceK